MPITNQAKSNNSIIIKSDADVVKSIRNFRKKWKSTGGNRLAIGKNHSGLDDICKQAFKKAYAPSVRRALKKPKNIDTVIIRKLIENDFIDTLKNLLISYNKQEVICLACRIRCAFRIAGITDYTFGNAFKHITVAIKYILSANGIDPLNPLFKECYIPVDRIIQIKALTLLNVAPLTVNGVAQSGIPSWGQCDNISDYTDYQKRLRNATAKQGWYSPLIWEIENW